MNASARKAIVVVVLLIYLAGYVVLAATFGTWLLARVPAWGALIYFAIAGMIWILPLKPLFGWMNRGAKREG
jgi:hypothetical protein